MPTRFAGFTRAGRLLWYQPGEADQTGGFGFTEFALEGTSATARHFDVRVPRGVEVREVAVSPGGDRLAWLLGGRPSSSTRPPVDYSLWISGLDGSGLRELGRTRLKSEKSSSKRGERVDDRPWGLRWVPDGRQVSFLYGDGLFAAPADELMGRSE